MTTVMEGVEVKLGRLDTDWRKFAVIVQVHSILKPGFKANCEIDPGEAGSQEKLLKMVGAAGGAGAEYLADKYGDALDPTTCVIYAQRAFLEEMKLCAELAKEVPAKLKRLDSNKFALQNNELELFDRLQWLVNHDEKLTPNEVHALDTMLGRLHGEQLG